MKVFANNGTHNHTTAPKQSGHNTTNNYTAYLADNDNCACMNSMMHNE